MVKFGDIQLNELFIIETGGDVIISNTKEGMYPLVSHQHDNNGIVKYIAKLENKKLYNHNQTIALADRGVFYATTQKQDFYIGTRVKALIFIDGEKNEKIRLYVATAINKLQKMFKEYLDNATDKLPFLKIKLPIDNNGNIDYKYMEEHIDEIKNKMIKNQEDEYRKKINEFIKLSNIKKIECDEIENNYFETFMKKCKEVNAGEYFDVLSNPQLNKDSFVFNVNSIYPYFTRTVLNNGIAGYVDYLDNEHLIKGNCIAVGMLGLKFFYIKNNYYSGAFTKTIRPKFYDFDEEIAMYFITQFNKNTKIYKRALVRNFKKEFLNTKILIPFRNNEIDFDEIKKLIRIEMKKTIKDIETQYLKKINDIKLCFE